MKQLSIQGRIDRIGRLLRFTPTERGFDLIKRDGQWWLVGGREGDHRWSCTRHARTLPTALDAIEAWMAPEIDSEEAVA